MTRPTATRARDSRTPVWLAPLAVGAVLALAAVLRFWALGRPGTLVFDELYYVRDAVSQLVHGFPTTWPDDNPEFGGERARAFSDQASAIAHPPLGKWLIGLGVLLFGADTGWGWRSAVACAGVATVAVTMRLGWVMSRSVWIACLAGFLLAIDGVHVVLTRVALLDGFLTLFVALGALFVWKDLVAGSTPSSPPVPTPLPPPHSATISEKYAIQDENGRFGPGFGISPGFGVARRAPASGRIAWRRPWLLAAGLSFGAAAAVKWSGLYPLAAFLLLIVLIDAVRRYRRHERRPLARTALQAVVTALIALPAAAIAYLASWWGWIASPTAQNRRPGEPWWVSLAQWHADALAWHATLSAPHPFQSHPLTWPLGLRPTAMYEVNWPQGPDCAWPGGCTAAISPLPNLLVTWGGVAALLLLAWALLRTGWNEGWNEGRIAARRSTAARTPAPAPARIPAPAPARLRSPINPGAAAARLGTDDTVLLAAAVVLVGYLAGWVPWLLTVSRSAVFQFYAVVLTPFSALALALVLGALWVAHGRPPRQAAAHPDGAAPPSPVDVLGLAGIRLDASAESVLGRRIAIVVYLAVALVVSVLFFPVWSGQPVAEWFWRAHLWLPGWE